jgi:hypothetical protein
MEPRVETVVDQDSIHWIESEGAAMDAPYLRSAFVRALAEVRANQTNQEFARLRRRTKPLKLSGSLIAGGILAAGSVAIKGPPVVGVLISLTLLLAGATFAITLASIEQPLESTHDRTNERPKRPKHQD